MTSNMQSDFTIIGILYISLFCQLITPESSLKYLMKMGLITSMLLILRWVQACLTVEYIGTGVITIKIMKAII